MRPPFDVYHDTRDDRLATMWSPVEALKGTSMRRQHAIAYYLVILALISATGFILGLLLFKM